MAKLRIIKSNNFSIVSNGIIRDKTLSLKARGLLIFMLSLPDNWEYSIQGLTYACNEGRESIRTGVRELEKAGYLFRQQQRDDKGRMGGAEYVISETPQSNFRTADNSAWENPPSGFSTSGGRPQINIDITNYEKNQESREQQQQLNKTREQVVVNAFGFWEQNMGPLTPHVGEELQSLVAEYSEPVVVQAMQIAVEQGKRTLAYTRGCAKNLATGASTPRKQAGGSKGNRDLKDVAAEVEDILVKGGFDCDDNREFDPAVWGVWASK